MARPDPVEVDSVAVNEHRELNVHLELPEPWATRARELCRRLRDLGNAIDLDATTPHVTVYLARYPVAETPAVVAALEGLARESSPIETRVVGVRFAGRGYVFLDLERTAALERLHARTLERLSPLRRGLVPEDVRALAATLPARERELAAKHAFPWVEELYAPHATIGKLPAEAEADAEARLAGERAVGDVRLDTLALGETGEHGTVARTVGRATLGDRAGGAAGSRAPAHR